MRIVPVVPVEGPGVEILKNVRELLASQSLPRVIMAEQPAYSTLFADQREQDRELR